MKNKYSLILAVCFLFSLVFLLANQGQNPQWKGTIEEEDGIKVIHNPREPLYGEITFDLEEDLSIGNEEDENYLFYKIRDIQVDKEGKIYVLDSGNHRLQVFDRNGNYIRTIGKKGQGPGELNIPRYISIDNINGNILVADSSLTISVFDNEGNYIDKDIHIKETLNDFSVSGNQRLWTILYSYTQDSLWESMR